MTSLLQQPVRERSRRFHAAVPLRSFAARCSGTRPGGSVMTGASLFVVYPDSETFVTGELIDALIEAVVLPKDPHARSAVICTLVHEICEAVEWLHAGDEGFEEAANEELLSLRQVEAAAQDHHERMRAVDAPTAGGGSR
jgi:hypothetical protein